MKCERLKLPVKKVTERFAAAEVIKVEASNLSPICLADMDTKPITRKVESESS